MLLDVEFLSTVWFQADCLPRHLPAVDSSDAKNVKEKDTVCEDEPGAEDGKDKGKSAALSDKQQDEPAREGGEGKGVEEGEGEAHEGTACARGQGRMDRWIRKHEMLATARLVLFEFAEIGHLIEFLVAKPEKDRSGTGPCTNWTPCWALPSPGTSIQTTGDFQTTNMRI